MTSLLERIERLEAALVAAPPPDGGPAQRISSDYGARSKKKGGGRKVASKAGEKRYGLPIGTPLGQGKAKDEQDAYNRFTDQKTPADLTRAATYMSNGDLALTAKAVFGNNGQNEWDKAAQMALVRELAARGIDPHGLGYTGGFVPLNPNPKKDPTLPKKSAAKKIDRDSVDAEKLSDTDLEILQKAGWKGDPNDQKEALYAPDNPKPLSKQGMSRAAVDMLVKQGWKTDASGNLAPPLTPSQKDEQRVAKEKKAAMDKAVRDAQTAEQRRAAEKKRADFLSKGLEAELARLNKRR